MQKTSENVVNNELTIKKTDQADKKDATSTNGAATGAATVAVSGTNGTASKLPPRPADYDYYWDQDEDGNWRNEYDDYGSVQFLGCGRLKLVAHIHLYVHT